MENNTFVEVRNWNKKVIYEMQEVQRQLNAERKQRKDLETWKVETEAKMEEMKAKVKKEVDARLKLEEAFKKLEAEFQELSKHK